MKLNTYTSIRTKMILTAAAMVSLLNYSVSALADSGSADMLGRQRLKITSTQSELVINKMMGDIRVIFQNFQPAVDSSTKIVSPLTVTGSSTHPFMEVGMEKCVFLFCETVDMRADITIREVPGKCTKNLLLSADISKSSELLANVYDSLDFNICFMKAQDGTGTLDFVGSAHQASTYSAGVVQGMVYNLMKLQVAPIASAINKDLIALSRCN
jgi:hypothetical protein